MKKILLIALIIFSTNSWAMECEPQVELNLDFEEVLSGIIEKKRDWWAASEEKIASAPCRKTYPSFEEQEQYLKKISRTPPVRQKKVNGFEIEDSPAMVALFDELTKFDDFGMMNPNDPESIKKQYGIGVNCKKADCVLGKIFGDKRAKEMLYMKQKFGLNTSSLTRAEKQPFSPKEFEHLQKAIMDFPPHLLPLKENQSCTRLHQDSSIGLGVLANATVTFSNVWTEYKPEMMQATVFHEISHLVGMDKSFDSSNDWLSLSGWEQKDLEWSSGKDNFVSNYAASNPSEDFAESMVAYRYDPTKLKILAPEKYNFLKEKVFGGVEYLKAEMCLDSNLEISKAIKKIDPLLKGFSPHQLSPEMRKELVSYCKLDTLQYILDRAYGPFNDCMEGAMILALSKEQIKKDRLDLTEEQINQRYFNNVSGRNIKDVFKVSFSGQQKTEIAAYSQALIDEYEVSAFKKNVIYIDYPDAVSYCDRFGNEHIYQIYQAALENDMKDNTQVFYNNREAFHQLVKSKCLRVQKTFSKFRAFKEKDYQLLVR